MSRVVKVATANRSVNAMDTAVQEQPATTPPRKMRTYGGRRRMESPGQSFRESLGATSPPARAAVPKSPPYDHYASTEIAELTPKSKIRKLMEEVELENETSRPPEMPSPHVSPSRSVSRTTQGDDEGTNGDDNVSFKAGSLLGRLKAHEQMAPKAKSAPITAQQSETRPNAGQKSAVAEGLNRFHDMLSRTIQDEIDTKEMQQNKSLAPPRLPTLLQKTPARQSPTSSVTYATETPAPHKAKQDQLSKKEIEEKRREEERVKRNQALAIGAKPLFKKPMNEFLASLTSEDALYNSHSSSPIVNQTSSPAPTYSSQTPAEDGSCGSPFKLPSADKGKGRAVNDAPIIRRVVPKVARKASFSDDSDIEIVLPKTPAKQSLTSPARREDMTHRKLRMLGAIPVSPVAKPSSKSRASASPSAKPATNSKAKKSTGKENWQGDLQYRISEQMALIRAKNEAQARAKGIVIKEPEEWLVERERLNAQLEQMISAKAGSSRKVKVAKGEDEDESDDEDYMEGQETGTGSKSDEEDGSDEELDFLSGSEDEDTAASGSDREMETAEPANSVVIADMQDRSGELPPTELAEDEDNVQTKSRRKARRVIDDEDEDSADIAKTAMPIEEAAKAVSSMEESDGLATQPLEDLSQMPANIDFGGMSQFFKATQDGQPPQTPFDKAFEDGGMSQFFKPSQSQAVETGPRSFEDSQVLLAMPTFFGRDSQVDLDEDSQTKLPSIRLSYEDSQTQQPSQYINAEGLLTQTKPTSFSFNDGAGSPQVTDSVPIASVADRPNNDGSPQASHVIARRRLSKRSSLADSSRQFSDSDGDDEVDNQEPDEVNSDDEDSESEDDRHPVQPLHDVLRDAAPKKKSAFVDAEAEEEEDEYMGMGGADGSDDGNDSDASELRAMITKGNEKVDESLIAEAYQRQEFEKDNRMLTNIMEDLANGGMRRRRGAGFAGLGDSDDEMDGGFARQRRLMKKKRKIDGDDALDALAENPETAAFAKVYTQDDDEDKMDFLDEEDSVLPGTAESQDQSTQIMEDVDEIIPETVQRRGPVHLDLDDEEDAAESLISGGSLFSLSSSTILTSTSSTTEINKTSVETSSMYVAGRSAFGSSFTTYNSALVRKTSSSKMSPRRLARFASMDDRHGSKAGALSSVTTLVRPALSDSNRQYNVRRERPQSKAKSAHKENKNKSKSTGKLLSLLNKEFN